MGDTGKKVRCSRRVLLKIPNFLIFIIHVAAG